MEKYNGFKSEADYKVVKDIIKNAIADYAELKSVEYSHNHIEVETITNDVPHYDKFFIDKDGVFYVWTKENMTIYECKTMIALNDVAKELMA